MKNALSHTEILGEGVVALLDVMGNDEVILDSARRSYSSNKTKVFTEAENRSLMRYLMRHRHTSVYEMCEARFFLRIPIFVARQLVRHRTANINELSGRYSELPESYYIPDIEQLGPQSTDNKQGRGEVMDVTDVQIAKAQQTIRLQGHEAFETYDSLLHVSGVSREIARIVLPLSSFTEMYWKCDLHNLFHFLRLRLHPHAQYEIRIMAEAMYAAIQPHFPLAVEAFEDYQLRSRTLSRGEQDVLACLLAGESLSEDLGVREGLSLREYREFVEWYESLRSRA